MAIQGSGLHFFPLFWCHHDSWTTFSNTVNPIYYRHTGHTHLWMMGYDWENPNQDAFSGFQSYKFTMKDIWGPRSADPNQMLPYRVVGTPRWSFHVKEVWRRIYIQPWDEDLQVPAGTIVGRRGIRWDASARNKTFGPFREGRGFAPLFIDAGARTLPLEYFKTEERRQDRRDDYVRDKLRTEMAEDPDFDLSIHVIPDGNVVPRGAPGGVATYQDGGYIHPIIEYQEALQLDWERPEGWQAAHDIDDESFGDGWSTEITIPYVNPVTKKYRSPFANTPGVVLPPGQYNDHQFSRNGQIVKLVPDDRRLVNRKADNRPPADGPPPFPGGFDYRARPFGLNDEDSEQPTVFKDPYDRRDGRWVQQCLGGMVQARATVTLEHRAYGKDSRQEVSISSVQYLPAAPFAGTDQSLPEVEE